MILKKKKKRKKNTKKVMFGKVLWNGKLQVRVKLSIFFSHPFLNSYEGNPRYSD